MATLFSEIFNVIRGRCISDESASVAAAEVAELVEEKFTSTNKPRPKQKCDICGSVTRKDRFTGEMECTTPEKHGTQLPPSIAPNYECG